MNNSSEEEVQVPKSIINIADVELTPRSAQFSPSGASAEFYDLKMSRIAPSLGAENSAYWVGE